MYTCITYARAGLASFFFLVSFFYFLLLLIGRVFLLVFFGWGHVHMYLPSHLPAGGLGWAVADMIVDVES